MSKRVDGRAAVCRIGALFLLPAALLMASVSFDGRSGRAMAQDTQALINKIDRLQKELQTLQRAVYTGEGADSGAALSTGGTGSASGAAPGSLSKTQAARIEVRLNQFESAMQGLTGQLEDINFSVQNLTARMDRLVADVDQRLQRLEGAGGVAQFDDGDSFQSAQSTGGSSNLGQQNSGSASGASAAAGAASIGVISQSDVDSYNQSRSSGQVVSSGDGTQTAYALPGQTAREQYQHAFSLLQQRDFDQAELALSAFLNQHPEDPLAGNAKYWLGETYYVREDFERAAVTFAEAYQEFPNSSKAPDNLLKLGMSLAALGSTDDACGTQQELLVRYPGASRTILQRAERERSRLGCP
ncbi:MAG: tol-pal system protein YbgF [Pseudomonadota bacterium]